MILINCRRGRRRRRWPPQLVALAVVYGGRCVKKLALTRDTLQAATRLAIAIAIIGAVVTANTRNHGQCLTNVLVLESPLSPFSTDSTRLVSIIIILIIISIIITKLVMIVKGARVARLIRTRVLLTGESDNKTHQSTATLVSVKRPYCAKQLTCCVPYLDSFEVAMVKCKCSPSPIVSGPDSGTTKTQVTDGDVDDATRTSETCCSWANRAVCDKTARDVLGGCVKGRDFRSDYEVELAISRHRRASSAPTRLGGGDDAHSASRDHHPSIGIELVKSGGSNEWRRTTPTKVIHGCRRCCGGSLVRRSELSRHSTTRASDKRALLWSSHRLHHHQNNNTSFARVGADCGSGATKLIAVAIVIWLALLHLDNVHCFQSNHHQLNTTTTTRTTATLQDDGPRQTNVSASQLVLGLGLVDFNENVTDQTAASSANQSLNRSHSDSGGRWNFGQRLLGLGNGATTGLANGSLLARTLRHLNGKLSKTSGGAKLSLDDADKQAATTYSQQQQQKKDYETIQVGNTGSASSIKSLSELGSSTPSSKQSASATRLARPNLSLDAWAKLINLRNVNMSGAHAGSALGLKPNFLLAPNGAQVSLKSSSNHSMANQRLKTSFQFGSSSQDEGRAKPMDLMLAGSSSSSPLSAKYSVTTSLPLLVPAVQTVTDAGQETLSIGIVIKPNGTFEQTKATFIREESSSGPQRGKSFQAPDWQASNDIEQVIYVGGGESSDAKKEEQQVASKQAMNKQAQAEESNDGEHLKGHNEVGHWSKEKHGAEGEQGQTKKGAEAEAKRLVDVGHNKHGWKNVYHKEEWAQHHKYHDVFRDKDWHDKRSKQDESHQYNKGNKFNESLAKSYIDKDKEASKYDYRKGSGWKRSEEEHDRDEGQLAATSAGAAADETEASEEPAPVRALAHKNYRINNNDQEDHLKVGSNNRNSLEAQRSNFSGEGRDQEGAGPSRGDSSDHLDDDLVLEQMKARLEDMSEQYGGGGEDDGGSHHHNNRQAASNGVYELKRPPANVTGANGSGRSDWSSDDLSSGDGRRPHAARNQSGWHMSGGKSSDTHERNHPATNRTKLSDRKRLKQQATAAWSRGHLDDDNRTRYDLGDGSGTHANNDDDNDDSDDDTGGIGRPEPTLASKEPSAIDTNRPQVALARGEDKRNGLRLKLELDLGKSSAVNQAPVDETKQQQQRHNGTLSIEKTIPLGNVRRSTTSGPRAGPGLTNSLGHSIGSTKNASPSTSWQNNSSGLAIPIRLFDSANKQSRDEAPWRKQSTKSLDIRDDTIKTNARNMPAPTTRQQQQPRKEVSQTTQRFPTPQAQPPMQPTKQRNQSLQPPSQPIYVRHLEMNGGVVLGRVEGLPSNRSSAQVAFSHYDDSDHHHHRPAVYLGDDLTVDTSLANPDSSHLFQQQQHESELTLAGANTRPAMSMIEHQNELQSPRELMLVFGGDTSSDQDDGLVERARHLAQASDTHHHHQSLGPDHQLTQFEPNSAEAKGEPSVIFEASASTIQDDLRPSSIDYYGQLPVGSSAPNDHLHQDEEHQLIDQQSLHRAIQRRRRNRQQRHRQATMMNDYLNYDYSTAHLSYANAPPPPPPLSSVQMEDEPATGGESLYLLNDENRLMSQQSDQFGGVSPSHNTVDGNQFQDSFASQPGGGQLKWANLKAHEQLRPSSSSQTAKPMMATLRDHMNSLPLSLLRAASSVNYALLTSQPPSSMSAQPTGPAAPMLQHQTGNGAQLGSSGATGSPASFIQQSLSPTLVSSAASVIPFASKWLRLPRVLENQLQQQRSKRYKQLAEQATTLAPFNQLQQQQQLQQPVPSVGHHHQWGPMVSRPYHQSPSASDLARPYEPQLMMTMVDPMQAEFSLHAVSHVAGNSSAPPRVVAAGHGRLLPSNHHQANKTLRAPKKYHETKASDSLRYRDHHHQHRLQADSNSAKHFHNGKLLSNNRARQTQLLKHDYNKEANQLANNDKTHNIGLKSADNNKRDQHLVATKSMRTKKSNHINGPLEYGSNMSNLQTTGGGASDGVIVAAASVLQAQRVNPMNHHGAYQKHSHRQRHTDHRQQSAALSRANYQLVHHQRPPLSSSHANLDERHQGLLHKQLPLHTRNMNQNNRPGTTVSKQETHYRPGGNQSQQVVVGNRLVGQQQQQQHSIDNKPDDVQAGHKNRLSGQLSGQSSRLGANKQLVKSTLSSFGQRVLGNLKFTKSI